MSTRGVGAITPEWLADVETDMQALTESSYTALNEDSWWRDVLTPKSIASRKVVFAWLLSTAQIKFEGKAGGNKHFEEIMSQSMSFETQHAGNALRLHRDRMLDADGSGLEVAGQWSRDMGEYMAYWPQKLAADMLMNGVTAAKYIAYTGKQLFANNHPLNPYKLNAGTYSNLFTGNTITGVDAASLQVLINIFALIASVKQANGKDPRRLRPQQIYAGPKLFPIFVQLTGAKFLSSAGAGSSDYDGLIKMLGYAKPVLVDELVGFEGDTTFFVGAKPPVGTQLGAGIYVEREAFNIGYYTGDSGNDPMLRRLKELEWDLDGRNEIVPGHPFMLYKCTA